MPKVLEDSLGNLEYLLLGLTFLGVLYLVVKQAGLAVNVSKEGYHGDTHGLRFKQEDDAGNRAGWYPKQKGYEGFSVGSMEPPVWHMTPFDPKSLNQQRDIKDEVLASEEDLAEVAKADAKYGNYDKYNTTEGLRAKRGYSKVSSTPRQGMLDAAMTGHNISLA